MSSPFSVIDPRTGAAAATVDATAIDQVASTVAAAEAARHGWAATSPGERVDVARAIAAAWAEQIDALTAVVLSELGQPERFTRTVHVENPIHGAVVMADLVAEVEWSRRVGESTVERVPVGVVAALTPWNYPVHQVVAKVVAALLAGCCVVLKPSELAPTSAALLVELARPLLPHGVLGIVQGAGADVGAALVTDASVDLVSFTGSAAVGRRVAAAAALVGTPSMLELGGRSPALLLDDLDETAFARAIRYVVADAMSNAGQTCNALSRLVVPRGRLEEALEAAAAAAARFVPGSTLGPVRRATDVERLTHWVSEADTQGARIVVDGRAAAGTAGGFWFGPTILVVEGSHSSTVRDEVFGPVLTIEPYDDSGTTEVRDSRGVAVATAASLGLSAAVWSADSARAERVAARIRAGQVRINGARWDFGLPFGGVASAGWGREWGREGIEALTTTRTLAR